MFFEQECVVFELLDVLSLEQSNIKMFNSNRNFDALSFRYEANTVLSTEKQQFALSDKSICYVPSNLAYTRTAKKDKLIVVHFKSFNYNSDKIEVFIPENTEKYSVLFKEILDRWNGKEISYKNECSAIFSKILAELYKDNRPSFENKKINKSVLYIEQNCLNKDFSLSDAAAKSFMSETYFRKLFKKEYNISPKHYVIKRRIDYAKALILGGYFSVHEIADLCGYNDEKHFSAEFKKITGVPPSKYTYNYGRETEKEL